MSKGNVTISIEDYENLVNGFENSKDKKRLEHTIEFLKTKNSILLKENQKIISNDFLEVKSGSFFHSDYFIVRKNKTPLWITKLFNKL